MKFYINYSTIRSVVFLTLMGSSSLNTHGISKRVIYSESVNKMLQYGIEKFNFSDSPVFGPIYFNQTLMGSSSLNTHGISKRVVYSESVNKMLQYGIEKLNFSDGRFGHICKPTKL